jgi:hypothetical protein
MPIYTFAECLHHSYRVNWRIDEVLGGRDFDAGKRWLPQSLSGASRLAGLDPADARKLTHVEMAAYAHLFAYVEEFIAPKVTELARDFEIDHREAYDALTNFAAEEVKHMNMFRRLRARVNHALGFEAALVGGQKETARLVLSKDTGAVLLLTSVIEWFTQRHYLEAFQDDDALDPFTKHVFKAHWLEESQHAKMDHLETLRAFDGLPEPERDRAVGDLIELVGALDGLLQQQVELDLRNFETHRGRGLSASQRGEIRASLLRAKRWTFIESGTTHPRFLETFEAVTSPAQRERVASALADLVETPVAA